MLADPVMGDNGPATPAPDNSQRQRVLMALMQQRGMGQQGGGVFGGLNTAMQNGMMMYGMRKPQARIQPMGMAPAPDPVMGQGTGVPANPNAYDYLRPKG